MVFVAARDQRHDSRPVRLQVLVPNHPRYHRAFRGIGGGKMVVEAFNWVRAARERLEQERQCSELGRYRVRCVNILLED